MSIGKRMSVNDFDIMIKADTSELIQEVTRDIYSGVVKRTPVHTGRARASWNIGVGTPDLRVSPPGNPASPIPAPTTPRFTLKDPMAVYITNSIPYLQYLENGSPTTVATGMIKATMSKYS